VSSPAWSRPPTTVRCPHWAGPADCSRSCVARRPADGSALPAVCVCRSIRPSGQRPPPPAHVPVRQASARKATTAPFRSSDVASASAVRRVDASCGFPRFRSELAIWMTARRRRSPTKPASSAAAYSRTARSGRPVESNAAPRSNSPIALPGGSSETNASTRPRIRPRRIYSSRSRVPRPSSPNRNPRQSCARYDRSPPRVASEFG
jgi:hypothetical protein